MAAPSGIHLNHIARSTADVPRLVEFYTSVLGFRRLDTPNFGDFAVAWLHLPPSFSLHLIQRNPDDALPEASPVRDPAALPRGHHIAFAVENYEEFVKGLRERGGRAVREVAAGWEDQAVLLLRSRRLHIEEHMRAWSVRDGLVLQNQCCFWVEVGHRLRFWGMLTCCWTPWKSPSINREFMQEVVISGGS